MQAGIGELPFPTLIADLQPAGCEVLVRVLGLHPQQLPESRGIERADRGLCCRQGSPQGFGRQAGVFLNAGERRGHGDAGFHAGDLGDGLTNQQKGADAVLLV